MIYFILNENRRSIKIGFSNNPNRRLAELKTSSPDPLELLGEFPGDRRLEKSLHRLFANHRLSGEWFRDCDAVRVVIRMLADNRITDVKPRGEADYLAAIGSSFPEVAFLATSAVGFPVLIHEHDALKETGMNVVPAFMYRAVRWSDVSGTGCSFWKFYEEEMPQWFCTPVSAAEQFVFWWREWVRQGRNNL